MVCSGEPMLAILRCFNSLISNGGTICRTGSWGVHNQNASDVPAWSEWPLFWGNSLLCNYKSPWGNRLALPSYCCSLDLMLYWLFKFSLVVKQSPRKQRCQSQLRIPGLLNLSSRLLYQNSLKHQRILLSTISSFFWTVCWWNRSWFLNYWTDKLS